MRSYRPARLATPQMRGFTLVEVMVSMAIAIFLLGGLLTIVMNMRIAFGAQGQMAQLQDNERLAMTLLGDVVQQAGYYPDPTAFTAVTALPVSGLFATAGQSVFGTYAAGAPGDTIAVRYLTAANDGMINCTGGSNTTGGTVTYVNAFSVDAAGNLSCTLATNGAVAAAQPLVSNLTNLSVRYGVKTDFSVNNGAVDSYLKASEMTNANWRNVIAVRITLTFVNPLANQQGQPATIPFQRVVAVMNHAGVTE